MFAYIYESRTKGKPHTERKNTKLNEKNTLKVKKKKKNVLREREREVNEKCKTQTKNYTRKR